MVSVLELVSYIDFFYLGRDGFLSLSFYLEVVFGFIGFEGWNGFIC